MPANTKKEINAVLFKSNERFDAFRKKIEDYGIHLNILDFEKHDWITYDYSNTDFIIYYPSFQYSSNFRQALNEVYDNISFIQKEYPNVKIYPDPNIIRYYNDKYRQYLFLQKHEFPIPETVPLLSDESVDLADKLGFPLVLKNRYGAGGGSVWMIKNRKELDKYYQASKMNLFNLKSLSYLWTIFSKRLFYYHAIKEKRMPYPFLSTPLLAQKFVNIDKDLKTVTGHYKVVEAHWRCQATKDMWKMNIDGGGTGVWGKIPDEAIDLSVSLAKKLNTTWLNIDMILDSDNKFLITEFSPVWHHYAYKEKPSFVYEDDYNLAPLEITLDLERIIVESMI